MRFQGLVRSYTVVLLVALSPTGVLGAQPARGESRPATAIQPPKIRIDNFGQVDSHYYRGAQPSGGDYADLAALGVKTVINLTGADAAPDERLMVERAGMAYLHIPMTTHETPTPGKLAEFLKAVNDPARQPVYVHCVGGRHRTGVMTAVYRMTRYSWTADQAFEEMKRYRFGAAFLHPEFKQFVYGYRVGAAPANAGL